jgi:hypothetical protein
MSLISVADAFEKKFSCSEKINTRYTKCACYGVRLTRLWRGP